MFLMVLRINRKLKINIFDLLILATFLFLGMYAVEKGISEYLRKDVWVFDGADITKAIYVYKSLDNQGFLVEAEIEGEWVYSKEPGKISGIVANAYYSSLVIKQENLKIRVGGRLASKEDFAAKKIILKPIGKSSVKIWIDYLEADDMPDLQEKLSSLAQEINTPYLYSFLDGKIFLDVPLQYAPTEYGRFSYFLEKNSASVNMEILEKGIILNIRKFNIENLNSIENYIAPSKVVLKDAQIIFTFNKTLSNDDAQRILEIKEKYPFIEKIAIVKEPLVKY